MLTDAQRQAGIAHFQQAVADARTAIANDTSWFGFNNDQQTQDTGAVNIIANTVLPEMQLLASRADDVDDAKFIDLGHTAEQSLSSIKGYSASVTFDSIVQQTAAATVQQTAQIVGQAVDEVGKVAGFGLGALWKAMPLWVKVGGGVVAVGAAYWFVRPLLGIAEASE